MVTSSRALVEWGVIATQERGISMYRSVFTALSLTHSDWRGREQEDGTIFCIHVGDQRETGDSETEMKSNRVRR